MKDCGGTTSNKEKESRSGLMGLRIRDSTKVEKNMEKVFFTGETEALTRDSFTTTG